MFYSSPRLPDWPKQRQISRKRPLIPTRLVASHYDNFLLLFQLIMAPASDSSNEGVANEGGTSSTNGGDVGGGPTSIPLQKGSPPPYDHALYSNYNTANLLAGGQQAGGDLQIASFTNPTPATTSASYVGTTSFTNTFLRGILTSIDSKDPVVANAWLDTLLDAIDLLPPGEYLLKKFQLLIFEI